LFWIRGDAFAISRRDSRGTVVNFHMVGVDIVTDADASRWW
jgi:hypothetical protein